MTTSVAEVAGSGSVGTGVAAEDGDAVGGAVTRGVGTGVGEVVGAGVPDGGGPDGRALGVGFGVGLGARDGVGVDGGVGVGGGVATLNVYRSRTRWPSLEATVQRTS